MTITHASIAQALAPLLGIRLRTADVVPGPDGMWSDLVLPEGGRLRVVVGGYRHEGRVTFRGLWPTFRDGTAYSGGPTHAITCAAGRPAAALAKEIQRRLLPVYLPAFHEAQRYVAHHDAHCSEAELIAARLAESIGARVKPCPSHSSRRVQAGDGIPIEDTPEAVRRLQVDPGYVDTKGVHTRPTSVRFEVYGLDPDVALEVLRVLRAHEQRAATSTRARVVSTVSFDGTAEDWAERAADWIEGDESAPPARRAR